MSTFIDQALTSVPTDRHETRDHLKGLQAVFFISDYVMTAQTNNSLVVSKAAIIEAFANVSQDTSFINDRLRLWAERPGTLADHYQSISEVPDEKEHINAVKAALTENGLPLDTQGDLLLDCLRYAVQTTDINEMYGANPRRKEDATPYPAAFDSLNEESDKVFQHRFT